MPVSRAAAAAGVDGFFMEVHPDPDKAMCDGPNMIPLDEVESLLRQIKKYKRLLIDNVGSMLITGLLCGSVFFECDEIVRRLYQFSV